MLFWNKAGTLLATANASLRLWDTKGSLKFTGNPAKQDLWGVDGNRRSQRIVTVGENSSMVVWDSSGNVIKKIALISR